MVPLVGMKKNLLYIIFAVLTLPLLIFMADQVQRILSQAAYQPANIIVDTSKALGPVDRSWSAFAQGGEEPPPMLTQTVSKMRELSPRYIRLDHIYDAYSVVSKKDNGFAYDFSRLDTTVNDIIAMGALPFLSLSYMPPVLTSTGSLITPPADWNNWKNLVQATIEHYSGKNNKNLTGVYYEVWNEPDLMQFGAWGFGGDHDYRLLYFNAEAGAKAAQNVNTFSLGGPAAGSYYPAWVNNFLSYVSQNKLRLDFYSWHRYHKRPTQYADDARNIRNNLAAFAGFTQLPLVISEWGIDSDNTGSSNTAMAAAYTIAAAASFQNTIKLAFNFEVKDGPPPSGGKWGLLTHEKDANPLTHKPRFAAFAALNKLSGNQLGLTGSGTFVTGLAGKSGQTTTMVLSNYDQSSRNNENVPVTFKGLSPASYTLTYTYPLSGATGHFEMVTSDGTLSKSFLMPPNTILVLELTQSGTIAPVKSNAASPDTQTISLKNDTTPLIFPAPKFQLTPIGSMSFDIKPLWKTNDNSLFIIFEAPFPTDTGTSARITLIKQHLPEGNVLTFEYTTSKPETQISFPIDSWEVNTWHHLELGWNLQSLTLSVDHGPVQKSLIGTPVGSGKILTFYPIVAAIDNLKVFSGSQQVVDWKLSAGGTSPL
jgi:hypothetical protein